MIDWLSVLLTDWLIDPGIEWTTYWFIRDWATEIDLDSRFPSD